MELLTVFTRKTIVNGWIRIFITHKYQLIIIPEIIDEIFNQINYSLPFNPISKSNQLKIMICGDHSSGKTSLVNRFVNDKYTTIIQSWELKIRHNNKEYLLKIKKGDINSFIMNLNDATLFILMFDKTNINSLNKLYEIIKHFNISNPQINCVLVAGKCDLINDKNVGILKDNINELKHKLNCEYFQVSSKNRYGIEAPFRKLIDKHENIMKIKMEKQKKKEDDIPKCELSWILLISCGFIFSILMITTSALLFRNVIQTKKSVKFGVGIVSLIFGSCCCILTGFLLWFGEMIRRTPMP